MRRTYIEGGTLMLRTWHLITDVLVLGLIAGTTAACAGGPAAAPSGGAAPSTASSPGSPSAGTRTVVTAKAKPAGSRDPRFGTQYAILKSSKPSARQITYDLIEWFDGKEAVKACAEDGVQPAENDYCLGYYERNKNKRLRTMTVDPDAPIRVMNTGQWKSVGLAEFLGQVGTGSVIRFDIDAGRIVKLDQIFLP
jgi:hypothetical protein